MKDILPFFDKYIDNSTHHVTEDTLEDLLDSTSVNSINETSAINSTTNGQTALKNNWSYNYWPLISIIVPLVTVAGNLLVMVRNIS